MAEHARPTGFFGLRGALLVGVSLGALSIDFGMSGAEAADVKAPAATKVKVLEAPTLPPAPTWFFSAEGGAARSGIGGVTEADQTLPRVAFFGFQLINTSPQPTTPEETQRIRMLDDMFQQKLDASGRFKVVSIPSELRDKIAAAPEISNCNGCERDFALEAGADWAAWGTVQKVSNLILNINVYMEDARANKMEFVKSVDIRGNTDESWQRGLDYMLRHYLFHEP